MIEQGADPRGSAPNSATSPTPLPPPLPLPPTRTPHHPTSRSRSARTSAPMQTPPAAGTVPHTPVRNDSHRGSGHRYERRHHSPARPPPIHPRRAYPYPPHQPASPTARPSPH